MEPNPNVMHDRALLNVGSLPSTREATGAGGDGGTDDLADGKAAGLDAPSNTAEAADAPAMPGHSAGPHMVQAPAPAEKVQPQEPAEQLGPTVQGSGSPLGTQVGAGSSARSPSQPEGHVSDAGLPTAPGRGSAAGSSQQAARATPAQPADACIDLTDEDPTPESPGAIPIVRLTVPCAHKSHSRLAGPNSARRLQHGVHCSLCTSERWRTVPTEHLQRCRPLCSDHAAPDSCAGVAGAGRTDPGGQNRRPSCRERRV